jgi:hypothetical protein
MKLLSAILMLALFAFPASSVARSGGHYSQGGGHHGGHVHGFATSRCKSASCYRKHPGGTYVHPLTTRKHGQ